MPALPVILTKGQSRSRLSIICSSRSRRRVRGEGILRKHPSLLPACQAIDVVLNVDRAEKESHNAAECQSNVFRGVVIVFHRTPNAEDAKQIDDRPAKNE